MRRERETDNEGDGTRVQGGSWQDRARRDFRACRAHEIRDSFAWRIRTFASRAANTRTRTTTTRIGSGKNGGDGGVGDDKDNDGDGDDDHDHDDDDDDSRGILCTLTGGRREQSPQQAPSPSHAVCERTNQPLKRHVTTVRLRRGGGAAPPPSREPVRREAARKCTKSRRSPPLRCS